MTVKRAAAAKKSGLTRQVEEMERDLASIRRTLRRPLEAEVAKGHLTVPQTGVMQVVVRNRGGISLKELSAEVSLAHSTVSGIVDRLEKRGMIERRPDASDGRISRIYPASIVSEFVREKIPALVRGPIEAAMERATEEERTQIHEALRRLRELLEACSA